MILGLLLIFMAFRIGKSVMLHFGENLEPLFIFIGLAFLLAIGPLLRWYIVGMTTPNFKLSSYTFLEWVPFGLVLFMSFFIRTDWFNPENNRAIIVFASTIIFIYCHLAFYILLGVRLLRKIKKRYKGLQKTKSQKAILQWLQLLVLGFGLIWISYALNIIEEAVPYVIGPLMYSIVVYWLSYKAFRLKILDLDGNAFQMNDDALLFAEIKALTEEKELYLAPDISLSSLSKLLGKSTQKTSEIINQYAQQNFNDFINHYRIERAKEMLSHSDHQQYTIASIAFDTGFSSLSSFNGAFKKFEGKTPSAYRKAMTP